MNFLITGAAGNLGSHLARHLIESNRAVQGSMNDQSDAQPANTDQPSRASQNLHHLKLLIHRHELPAGIARAPNVTIHRADLANPATLVKLCQNTDCIIHFAGVLFAPRPDKFLPTTNTLYVQNLVNAALAAGAEKFLVGACEGTPMTPVVLRPGMIYARGVLMPDAARWLSRRRLLAVWNQPTWIHLLSLQEFLDRAAERWGGAWPWRRGHRPWRAPAWAFYAAAALTEAFAAVFRTRAPLTRDFIEGARSPW